MLFAFNTNLQASIIFSFVRYGFLNIANRAIVLLQAIILKKPLLIQKNSLNIHDSTYKRLCSKYFLQKVTLMQYL